jgi:hypothetical protein
VLLFPHHEVVVLLSNALEALFDASYWDEALTVQVLVVRSVTDPFDIRYCAPVPVMFIGTETLSHVTVIVLEKYIAFGVASLTGEKLNVSGFISATRVVTLNDSVTPPILRIALEVVLLFGDDVRRTCTVFQTLTLPVAEVNAPPFILYSPQIIERGVTVLIQEIVMVFEENRVEIATSVISENIYASGTLSAGGGGVLEVGGVDLKGCTDGSTLVRPHLWARYPSTL